RFSLPQLARPSSTETDRPYVYFFPCGVFGTRRYYVLHLFDLETVDADYYVADPKSGFICWTSRVDLDDQDAGFGGELVSSCKHLVECGPVDAEPGTDDSSYLAYLLDYPFDRVCWDCESDSLGEGYHCRVDSDYIAVNVR